MLYGSKSVVVFLMPIARIQFLIIRAEEANYTQLRKTTNF